MATERVLSNLNLISFKTEGGLQNHIDELQDGDLAFTPDNSLKGSLFDFKWADHLLDDISWLRADTFSWQSGDVYVAAYNHLVADFEGTTAETETIDGIEITYYRAEDKHKICLPDQEDALLELYNATGVAWYYILDTENKQFKLPRTKFGVTGLRDEVGGYVEAGLPNITGTFTRNAFNSTNGKANEVSGVFTSTLSNGGHSGGGGAGNSYGTVTLDASVGSDIYGNSDTVQSPATQMYLYFYVGNFERDAVEQTAGVTTETLNGKADSDLGNIPANYDYVVESQMPTAENGYTWYRKYKSGWVEQGGINTSSGAPSGYITLIIPMRSTDYWVMGQWRGSSATDTGAAKSNYNYAEPYSTTQILVGCYDTTNPCAWQVCGMAA